MAETVTLPPAILPPRRELRTCLPAAHLLAELVRLDRAHHRPVAGDSAIAEAVKVTARMHQSLIWDRTRHRLRLRSALQELFPPRRRRSRS